MRLPNVVRGTVTDDRSADLSFTFCKLIAPRPRWNLSVFTDSRVSLYALRKIGGTDMKRLYIAMFVLLATGLVRGDVNLRVVQDPLVVNSTSIKLKLENSRVRVLEATIEPGVKEKLHSHPAYVIYVIAGGKVRTHNADGTVTEAEFHPGDVIYREPVTHWAENIGNTTIRLELVELKN